MVADVFNMDGVKRPKSSPLGSTAIRNCISDVTKLNNSGQGQAVLVTMVMQDNTVVNNFATKGSWPISIVGALEAAKYFYLRHTPET